MSHVGAYLRARLARGASMSGAAGGVSKHRFLQWRDVRSGIGALGLRLVGSHIVGTLPPPAPPPPERDTAEAAERRLKAGARGS